MKLPIVLYIFFSAPGSLTLLLCKRALAKEWPYIFQSPLLLFVHRWVHCPSYILSPALLSILLREDPHRSQDEWPGEFHLLMQACADKDRCMLPILFPNFLHTIPSLRNMQ